MVDPQDAVSLSDFLLALVLGGRKQISIEVRFIFRFRPSLYELIQLRLSNFDGLYVEHIHAYVCRSRLTSVSRRFTASLYSSAASTTRRRLRRSSGVKTLGSCSINS